MSIILKKGSEANRSSLTLQTGEVVFTTDTRRLYVGSGSESNGIELSFNQLTASFISASEVTATSASFGHINATSIVGSIQSASYAATASYLLGSISSASYATTSETASWYIGSQLGVGTQYPIDTFGIVGGMTLQGTGSRKLWWLNPDFSTSGLVQVVKYPDGSHAFECIMYDTSSGESTGRFTQNVRGFTQLGKGDIISADTGGINIYFPWAGSSAVTGSGILVQRQGKSARSTLLSVGGATTGSGYYNIALASGTYTAMGPALNGHLGAWQVQTYGGSTWSTTARMMMQTSGDHNEGSRPTDIVFQTTPSGSSTLQNRLKINGTGVQVTGSLGVAGSIGINASMVMAKKFVALNTSSFATALTLNMADDTATYVKVSLHGAWQGSGSAVYVGEFFLQKDDSNTYRQPGAIISQVNNNACGEILANLYTPTPGTGAQDLLLQFWASSSAVPVGDFLMLYEVRGQYNTVT